MDLKYRTLPRGLYEIIAPLLPAQPERPLGGRPPLSNRRALGGILYRLKTGCQWKALPREFGSGSAVHRRFQAWVASDVFRTIFQRALKYYGDKKKFKLDWTSVDGASVKAPKGGS